MKARTHFYPAVLLLMGLLCPGSAAKAHFPAGCESSATPCEIVPSLGNTTVVIDFSDDAIDAAWAGITDYFSVGDYGEGVPLSAVVKAFHKSDGIYLLIVITDGTDGLGADSVDVYFDINHDGSGAVEAADWGIQISRDGTAKWGTGDTSPSTWSSMPLGEFDVTSTAPEWTAELRLPTGSPASLDLTAGTVGVYFALYDSAQIFGSPTAKYTQWPPPTDVTQIPPLTPDQWANYVFDPATTYPNIAVTGVRNSFTGSSGYYQVSYTEDNTFEVELSNPGGTALADATDVRVNLYLAARGLGESFKRIDVGTLIDSDCAAATWASPFVPKADVCVGIASHPDISTQTLSDIVSNTAHYTIKDGLSMNRLGGNPVTVPGGSSGWFDVLEWNTTAAQDDRFVQVVVGSTTYNRQHQCMMAEAIYPHDPNTSNNKRQVNMNFVSVPEPSPGPTPLSADPRPSPDFDFSVGWAGFGEYDPEQGKTMLLRLVSRNVDPGTGWSFRVDGLDPVANDTFTLPVRGLRSTALRADIRAPAGALGRTLKENLVVPPRAGGLRRGAKIPSGQAPVYVEVRPGSTLLVANYALDAEDVQFVDLDGKGFLPRNGPDGLSLPYLKKFLEKVDKKYRLLLVHGAPLGSLVGSFDNFRTGFTIGKGAQLRVPGDAEYLALGINGLVGLYNDNEGPGFRVKVTQVGRGNASASFGLVRAAIAQEPPGEVAPIDEVMPTYCLQGYEPTGATRSLHGKPHDLYRYLGEVCWGIVNVYPPDRPLEPEPGDIPIGRCGLKHRDKASAAGLATLIGLLVLGRSSLRKRRRDGGR